MDSVQVQLETLSSNLSRIDQLPIGPFLVDVFSGNLDETALILSLDYVNLYARDSVVTSIAASNDNALNCVKCYS